MVVYLVRTPIVIHPPSSPLTLADTDPVNMTVVLNDPSLWPLINFYRVISYFIVAASTAVVYDSALTFGLEFELIWSQHWTLMTTLYFSLRSAGILFCVVNILSSIPTLSMTDKVSTIIASTQTWMSFVVYIMLGVIIIARLHAMYQRSRKMLIFLVVVFIPVTLVCGMTIAIENRNILWAEFILSGTYQCSGEGPAERLLVVVNWVVYMVWEVLALSLAVWIAFSKHSREMKRWTMEDRFKALIQSHAIYFAAFTATACLNLGTLSAKIYNPYSPGADIYYGATEITLIVQMFVLGPRLILNVREYNAKLAAKSRQELGTLQIV